MNDVIVLIPHFNNIKGLYKSLASIGENENIDVLIVDDGSVVDIDQKVIKSFFKAKGEVFFEFLKVNSGIEIALNTGLKIILKKGYKYIARLDCGDKCLQDRFKKQLLFLENNTEISLVGTNVSFFDEQENFLYNLKVPTDDGRIRKKMYINAMHIHPSIMFRSSIIKQIGLYPVNYKAAEDYAFFFNVIKEFKVANINEILVKCEINSQGISTVLRKEQAKNRIKIIIENFYFGFYPIYGLLRSILLYLVPLKLLIKLKQLLKK